jgi:hypothetical protein
MGETLGVQCVDDLPAQFNQSAGYTPVSAMDAFGFEVPYRWIL